MFGFIVNLITLMNRTLVSPGGGPPPAQGSLLLEDGVSHLLLEDGVSKLLLES